MIGAEGAPIDTTTFSTQYHQRQTILRSNISIPSEIFDSLHHLFIVLSQNQFSIESSVRIRPPRKIDFVHVHGHDDPILISNIAIAELKPPVVLISLVFEWLRFNPTLSVPQRRLLVVYSRWEKTD